MTGIRENILASPQLRNNFLDAMLVLDQPNSGVMASHLVNFLQTNNLPLRMRGLEQQLSPYDLFVFWHVLAMSMHFAVGNAAHSGPIFLPWHRMYLLRLEEMCRHALDDSDFGLPYWDWATDGDLPPQDQWRTDLWSASYLGEARGSVRSGKLAKMQVRLFQDPQTRVLWSVEPRGIIRNAGQSSLAPTLPRNEDVKAAIGQTIYDQPPWNENAIGHRNILEGWMQGPQLHNRVHVWIGGDMGPGSSPNDPAFFLNHCNVDRIWEEWMGRQGRIYEPQSNHGPQGHRIDSQMVAFIGDAMTPQQVLNPSQWYAYR